MEKITGKNNELIKGIRKLLSSSKERRSQGIFVLEGARLVFDVLHSFEDCGIVYFLITEQALEKYAEQAEQLLAISEKSYLISSEIAQKLTDTQSAQGVFAVCRMKENTFALEKGRKYIALDNVQDPSNLGAIARTAEALGIDGMFVSGGCDIYNPKALRASMGSMLRLRIMQTDGLADVIEQAKRMHIACLAAVPDKGALDIKAIKCFEGGMICIIGNEANGISEAVKRVCTPITISMPGRAESLNASVAAAIIIWEMMR